MRILDLSSKNEDPDPNLLIYHTLSNPSNLEPDPDLRR